MHGNPGLTGIKFKVAQPGDQPYALLVAAASSHFFERSYVIPARELQVVLAKDKENKATKLPTVAGLCLKNPDTTTGLCVASEQIKVMKQLQEGRVQKEMEAVDKAEAVKVKNAEAMVKQKELALFVVGKARENPETWKSKVTVELLKAAYQFLVPKSKRPSKAPTKKDDLLDSVKEYVVALARKELDDDDLSGEESGDENGDVETGGV